MRFKHWPILALTLVGGVAGLAQTQSQMSGFLEEYPPLSPLEGVPNTVFWRNPDIEKKYRAVLVEPAELFLDPKSPYKGINVDAFKIVADTLRDLVATQIAEAHPIVVEPGPGVLRIRIALSNVYLKKGASFDWYQAVGPRSAARMRVAVGRNVSLVRAILEIEGSDSETGRRLGFVASQSGQESAHSGSWVDLVKRLDQLSGPTQMTFAFLFE